MDAVLEVDRVVRHGAPRLPEGAAGSLSLLIDELACGVLVVNARGWLLHANHAAQRELARHTWLTVREGIVQPVDPAQARLLADALSRTEGGRRSLVPLRSGRQRLSVAVVPLRAARAHEPRYVALLLSRATVCDPVMLCFFARTHGLTPAEEQVLGILCQGLSAPEIARQLRVAVSTVRSHVRSMCAKTHTNGVRALVGQVAVLPPIGACQMHDPLH